MTACCRTIYMLFQFLPLHCRCSLRTPVESALSGHSMSLKTPCKSIFLLEGRQTAWQKQKALRGIRSSSFLADMGQNVEEAQYGHFDASLAQDVGTGQIAHGRHQILSSFWTQHIQRAARAELALRINKAHKDAERERSLKWHTLRGHKRVNRTSITPVEIGGDGMFWPQLYSSQKDMSREQCEVPCRWSVKSSKHSSADIVMYHPFYDPAQAESKRQRPDQLTAIFSMEPIFGLNANDMDRALSGYEMLVHVAKHSDAIITYADTLTDIMEGNRQEEFERVNPLPDSFTNGSRAMLATFITTGCDTDPESKTAEQYSARNRFVKELTGLGFTFDHYGKCKYGTEANAAELPPPHKARTDYHGLEAQRRKVQLLKQYKFVLGLENIVQVDYVTEKFYQLFATGRVPIYLGAPNAAAYAPAGSFINALDYAPRQLARLIRQLDSDEQAYESYFAWQLGNEDPILPHFSHVLGDNLLYGKRRDGMEWVCKLCQLYHKYYDWPKEATKNMSNRTE